MHGKKKHWAITGSWRISCDAIEGQWHDCDELILDIHIERVDGKLQMFADLDLVFAILQARKLRWVAVMNTILVTSEVSTAKQLMTKQRGIDGVRLQMRKTGVSISGIYATVQRRSGYLFQEPYLERQITRSI
jgi:hypothetical protein